MNLHYYTLCQKYTLQYNDEMNECTDIFIIYFQLLLLYKYLQHILAQSLNI